jgi:hypothetical protein
MDPIIWTKKSPSLATLLPAFLTGNVFALARSVIFRYRLLAG